MLKTPVNREYVRTDSWSVVAKVSKEDPPERWVEVKVPNVAAGGLMFTTDTPFSIGDTLFFDLQIDPITPGIARIIKIKAKGEVRGDRDLNNGLHSYGVEFLDIKKNDQIRLDELVRMTSVKYSMDSEADS